ncbi:MAG: prefoldin subunit alpha, partial [Candidatus Diapherotrites archaeon]|nr:prefoldin subunit alpha [Candidatus Diapherotrites archaeon]
VTLTPQQLMAEFVRTRTQTELLHNRVTQLQAIQNELLTTQAGLEEISQANGQTMHVAIGSGVFIEAKVPEKPGLMVMLPSNVMIPGTLPKIREDLQKRLTQAQKAFEKAQADHQRSMQMLNALQNILASAQQQFRQQQAQQKQKTTST